MGGHGGRFAKAKPGCLDIGIGWNGSYGKTRDGYLMYGGTKGLALIAPEQFKPWDDQPPVRVTEFKADGQAWPMGAPNVEPQNRVLVCVVCSPF